VLRAIRKLLHWIWVGLDGLRKVLHLLLLLLIFGAIGSLFSRPIPLVPDRAALVIAPQGPLVEQFTGDPLERAIAEALRQGPGETRLRDLVDAIDAGREDERISSLYLDLGGLAGGGTAKLQEVAAAIDRFRKSGKPVIAFGEYYDQPQYYLAAHADQIYLDPQGIAYIDGFANYGMFVKDALDKLSIDWNVFRVGQYKSAVETFTRNDMSPAEREESLAWLNSMATSPSSRSKPGSSRASKGAIASKSVSPKSRAKTRTRIRTRVSISSRIWPTCARPRRSRASRSIRWR
jgi:protease IV